ncbi:MAG: retropepsin-like aspartic protease [Methylovulum sp.]|nr:retropepsin-like aspartic protease [Methylovulum sp.]
MQKIMLPLLALATLSTISLSAWGEGMIYKCKNLQEETVYKKSPCLEEGQTVSTWQEPNRGQKKTSIRQGKNGHYFLEGAVNNGTAFRFLIDTGASGVALPNAIAVAAKINCKMQGVTMHTANGSVQGCFATVPILKFGPFQLKNVEVMILPNLDQPLLGMDVLGQFNIEQDHGEMRISER